MKHLGVTLLLILPAAICQGGRPLRSTIIIASKPRLPPLFRPTDDGWCLCAIPSSRPKTASHRTLDRPSDGSAPASRLTTPHSTLRRRAGAPMESCSRSDRSRKAPGAEGDIWFLRMDRAGGEAFQIPGVGGMPIFSPDNRWIAFTKKTPPPVNRARGIAVREAARSAFQRAHIRLDERPLRWARLSAGSARSPCHAARRSCTLSRARRGTEAADASGVDVDAAAWRPDQRPWP